MSGAAIIMMLVAMAIIWGGLVAAIINLRYHTVNGRAEHDDGDGRDLPRDL